MITTKENLLKDIDVNLENYLLTYTKYCFGKTFICKEYKVVDDVVYFTAVDFITRHIKPSYYVEIIIKDYHISITEGNHFTKQKGLPIPINLGAIDVINYIYYNFKTRIFISNNTTKP